MRVGGGGPLGGGGGAGRRAAMEPGLPQGLVLSPPRLPPVASFARPAAPPPPDGALKKEPAGASGASSSGASGASSSASSGASGAPAFPRSPWGFLQPLLSIKQEKPADPEDPPPPPQHQHQQQHQQHQQHHQHHQHHHQHHHPPFGGLFAPEERGPGLASDPGGHHSVIQDLSSVLHPQQHPQQHPHQQHPHSHPHPDGGLLGAEEPRPDHTHGKKAKRPKPESSQGTKASKRKAPGGASSASSSSASAASSSSSSKPGLGAPGGAPGDGEAAVPSPSQKPHVCDHCSAAFRSSYHLRRHVLIHTGERPFQCGQCHMGFIQKYLLQRHEKIHSREKPFGCDQCSMKFIQKYHMERHRRTHSGEKPYKCDSCQQFFSRTDRLLKHRRTCGEAGAKGPPGGGVGGEPGPPGGLAALSQGSGTGGGSSRRKSKSKSAAAAASASAAENKEPKAGKASGESPLAGGLGLPTYSVEMPALSPGGGMLGGLDELQKRVPKLIFKKGGRKGADKSYLNFVPELVGPKALAGKPGGGLGIGSGAEALGGLLPGGGGGKQGPLSSYDDPMQFSKKRRYLPSAASNSAFSVGAGHLAGQPSVIQAAGVGALDGEAPLALLDADIKACQDKAGIPDEVLQSILEQYSGKAEGPKEDPFSLAEPRVDLPGAGELAPEGGLSPAAPAPPSDKALVLQEYSKYLQQAFEKSTNAGFALGHGFQFVSLSSPLHNHALFPEKQMYTTSPLECGFGQSVTSVLPSSLPKPPFGMLFGSQPGLYLSALDATHQQLTPSQELDDLIDSQKNLDTSPAFQPSSQKLPSQKEPPPPPPKALEAPASFPLAAQELPGPLDAHKDLEPRATYQIENFAQAFGSQFKPGGRVPMTFVSNANGEADHRVRTAVSDFSGYTNMMADGGEPCSTRVKTPSSQSYR